MQSQKTKNTQSNQTNPMQNETPLPYYLQQHEFTKTQPKSFSLKNKRSRITTKEIPYAIINIFK